MKAQLAVPAKTKKIQPRYWRVLDTATTEARWAGRIVKFVDREDNLFDGSMLTVAWVNGETMIFRRTEIEIATITDRLAWLSKLSEWERILKAEVIYRKRRDHQNQNITGDEVVEIPCHTLEYAKWNYTQRQRALQDDIDAWAEGQEVWEGDCEMPADFALSGGVEGRLIFKPFYWERTVDWMRVTVVTPPRKIGGPFEIASAKRSGLVNWYDVRRVEKTL